MSDWYTWYTNEGADLHIYRCDDIDGEKLWHFQFMIMTDGKPNIIDGWFGEKFRYKFRNNYYCESFEAYTGTDRRRRILIDKAITWKHLCTARKDIDMEQLKLKIVSVCNCIIHDKIPSTRLMIDLVWILNNPASNYSEPDYREYQKHIERNRRTNKYELDLDYATRRKIWASAFGSR